MEKTRTLPPLVRGEVTAVLDFFVDKIRVENNSLLMDTFDFVLQIQWWGEDTPIFIRPKKAGYQEGSISEEMHLYCARYEIKTALKLFKLYLKTCEVLELCVLDAIKRCIVGSAFLRDLDKLLDQSSNFITAPIFDYLGEEIGEVIICFRFLEKSQQNTVKKQEEIIYTHKNKYSGKLDMQNFKISNRTKTLTEEGFFTNGHKEISFSGLAPNFESWDKNNEKIEDIYYSQDDKISNVLKDIKAIYVNNEKVPESIKSSCQCLPEIITSSDSSKVLHFGLNAQKSTQKMYNINNSNNNLKIGRRNKFNSNLTKCKSYSKSTENLSGFPSDQSSRDGELIKKSFTNAVGVKNCKNKASKVMDMKKFRVPSKDKSFQSEKHPNHNQSLTEDIPSKQSIETKVLDFLLGSDLSKEDEESAVNEFRKMSPSHNLVMSLNQLCLMSDSSDSLRSRSRHDVDSSESTHSIGLTFDLSNPIERNYYEKFFLKSKYLPDLELAKFLNESENSAALEKLKCGESTKNRDKSDGFKSGGFLSGEKNGQKSGSEENFSVYNDGVNDNAKGCVRCKYYKKLDELDKIIESLKHFETKVLAHEKGMESAMIGNSKTYIKKSQPGKS